MLRRNFPHALRRREVETRGHSLAGARPRLVCSPGRGGPPGGTSEPGTESRPQGPSQEGSVGAGLASPHGAGCLSGGCPAGAFSCKILGLWEGHGPCQPSLSLSALRVFQ